MSGYLYVAGPIIGITFGVALFLYNVFSENKQRQKEEYYWPSRSESSAPKVKNPNETALSNPPEKKSSQSSTQVTSPPQELTPNQTTPDVAPEVGICKICDEDYELGIKTVKVRCGCVFHQKCNNILLKLGGPNPKCPTCKTPVF